MVSAPSLFPTVAEVSASELNFFIYFRKPDGWIVAAPGWPQEYAKRLRQGYTPLPQYGSFVPGHKSRDSRGLAFSAAREGWRVGFQKGGADFAREFPVAQIVAYNWHLTPPYREVDFPQIAGMDIPAYECPECVRPPLPTTQTLATHLRVGHDYSRVDLREYGKEVGIEFSARSDRQVAAELEAHQIAELTAAQTSVDREYGCDQCDWAPPLGVKDKDKSKAAHVRFKHTRARVPETEPAQEVSVS